MNRRVFSHDYSFLWEIFFMSIGLKHLLRYKLYALMFWTNLSKCLCSKKMTEDELQQTMFLTTFLEACQIKCVRDFLCFSSVTFQWFPCKSSWYPSLSGSSIMPCKSIPSILSSKTSQLSATMGSSHCPLYICPTYLWSHLSVQFKEIYSVVILFYSASFCLYYFIALCLSVPPYQFFPQPFVVSFIPVLFLFPLSQT